MSAVLIPVPKEFDFDQNLQFLRRSPNEVLHRIDGEKVFKFLQIKDERVLFSVVSREGSLVIEFINVNPSAEVKGIIKKYVTEWFDLETDLTPFYKLVY